jgi:hypothetical protein
MAKTKSTPTTNGHPRSYMEPPRPLDHMTSNELTQYLSVLRVQWLQNQFDRRRDLDAECGYPHVITPGEYRKMFDREGVATRVVSLYPDECWAIDPSIYETEDEKNTTPFEAKLAELFSSELDILSNMYLVDVTSGINRYGALFLGMNDLTGGRTLQDPLPGIDEDGRPLSDTPPKGLDILFLRPFDEDQAQIATLNGNLSSRRYGQPLFYNMTFGDSAIMESTGQFSASALTSVQHRVHWSRVIHVAEHRQTSQIFAVPRMQPVFNRLRDVRKILGGSAEMFWKGGFPGYAFELDPTLMAAGIKLDKEATRKEFQAYSDGLQRYIALVGMQAKSLAPQVASPEHTLLAQFQAIALALGVPLRIFMGSEQAQLASGQDVRTWNRRLMRRLNRYLTPRLIRPFIDRLISAGRTPPSGNLLQGVVAGHQHP